MHNIENLENGIKKETIPLDIQKTGDIDHTRRVYNVYYIGRQTIQELIRAEKENNTNIVERCKKIIQKCKEIFEKEKKYLNEEDRLLAIYEKMLRNGYEFNEYNLNILEEMLNELSKQIYSFLQSLYPIEEIMNGEEKNQYINLCNEFNKKREEYVLIYNLTLPDNKGEFKYFSIPHLEDHGLKCINSNDFEKNEAQCKRNYDITKKAVDSYIQCEQSSNIEEKNKLKRVIETFFYITPEYWNIYTKHLENYIIEQGININEFNKPHPGINTSPNGIKFIK